MNEFTIRDADFKDAPQIADFNCRMAQETENHILPPETVLSGVNSLLRKPELGFYLVAVNNEKVVGTLMIVFEWSDWRDGLIWWIHSVYIPVEYRRKGIFRQMYKSINKKAKENQVVGLRLYVERNNYSAQETYKSLGMKETNYKIFEEMF